MKKFGLIFCAVLFCTTLSAAYKVPKKWTANIDAALVKAAAEKKKVLVLFTGSDWCTWCKRLRNDVLDKKEFERLAAKNFILVYFDFPYKDKKISIDQKNLQQSWQQKLNVSGYPTTVILDGKGKKLTSVAGYLPLEDYLKAIMPPYNGKKKIK